MAVFDLITLADLKDYMDVQGTNRDSIAREAISVASRTIERHTGRRLIYRAPPEVSTKDNVVPSVTLANGAVGGITQPSSSGRTLIVSIADPGGTLKAGTITITGTLAAGGSKTAVFDVTNGLLQHGVDFFSGSLTITVANLNGGDSNTKLAVGTSVGYLEYHTPESWDSELLPYEWPLQSMLEVNEDMSRVFASATKLTAGTDFIITPDDPARSGGILTRVNGAYPIPWLPGWRGYKLVYSAGYAGAGAVPDEIRDACRRFAASLYDEIVKKRLGVRSQSDATGNWTRFGPATLTPEMQERLESYRRKRFGTDSGHRDFDLEAA